MDEFFRFFSESNITLSKEQILMFNRLTEKLSSLVKGNNDKNDEIIMRSKEQEELTRFVSFVFITNKKVMGEFAWRTLVTGFVSGARRNREY